MKVELHLHTSRYSACARHSPEELLSRLIKASYEAVYLTEHDAVWPDRELAVLQEAFPRIRVFPGVELTVGEVWSGQHLLVLGTCDPTYLEVRDPSELLAKARSEGHLTILAHPLRWQDSASMLWAGHLPDALECQTCNHDDYRARIVLSAAKHLGLPLVNAGDVHRLEHVDRYWIETAHPIDRRTDIRTIVRGNQYVRSAKDTLVADER